MSPAAEIALTPQQHQTIDMTLEAMQSHIAVRGAALMRSRAVRKMKWSAQEGNVLEAQVQGSKLYTVRLQFAPHGRSRISLTCTCAYGVDCKHAIAALLELRKHAAPAKSAAPPPAKKAAKAVPPPPAPDSLAGLVAARLGAPLSKGDRKFLEFVEPWWRNRSATMEIARLYQAVGRASYWGYAEVALFPPQLPPENVWEFLAYLAEAMKATGLAWPEALAPVLDPALAQRLLERWKRQQEIAQWRDILASWDRAETAAGRAAPELRLQLYEGGALVQMRQPGMAEFGKATVQDLRALVQPAMGEMPTSEQLDAGSFIVLCAVTTESGHISGAKTKAFSPALAPSLSKLLAVPDLFQKHVVNPEGLPLTLHQEPLQWRLNPPAEDSGDYELGPVDSQGTPPHPAVAIVPGDPLRYVTPYAVYPLSQWPLSHEEPQWPLRIPMEALESSEGVNFLARLGLAPPPRLEGKIKVVRAEVVVRCALAQYKHDNADYLRLEATASIGPPQGPHYWTGHSWQNPMPHAGRVSTKTKGEEEILSIDRAPMNAAAPWLRQMRFDQTVPHSGGVRLQQRITARDFPEQFSAWLERRPRDITVELDPELASLRDGKVSGQVRLDIEESKTGIDWFDLSVALEVTDHSLTQEEIDLLMKAKGKWVRLPGKGWRKLEMQLSEEQNRELAELGLAAEDFTGEKQRLHALQLSGAAKTGGLLPAERAEQVRRRMEEIQTRVTPDLPGAIQATLRPYQLEGFHFLAYLTTNRFGGVLADDMGLGKTLQALAWMAWLRAEPKVAEPFLVICPKSVQDNWRAEAARFFPSLRVTVWDRLTAGETGLTEETDLLVIHYAQLRNHERKLCARTWGAVILDEAQAIKNPTSQSARAACALEARHRLALTGTPVENRLLDLWSILSFAMPGVLGNRATFARSFDNKEDPLARRRLAARTRPFLLRRTKKEVASDLPDRIEEDLVIELEGVQSVLYQAELKRARAQLLKAETGGGLDKLRFNILTSLLRLRQICCHPKLIGLEDGMLKGPPKRGKTKGPEPGGSAKVSALLELLEPLMEEGQKVLVFSQFVEMLEIIQAATDEQGWHSFKLTGQTEDRGALVQEFQKQEGAAVFLISLKAGGFGLNLTAASYVVLFDPWWNPAVEAQAIDRTHRIGQKQTVFAYRLLVKDSIEEKIRLLQKQKGALAQDILGEENFAQALTLSDFRFLLGEE